MRSPFFPFQQVGKFNSNIQSFLTLEKNLGLLNSMRCILSRLFLGVSMFLLVFLAGNIIYFYWRTGKNIYGNKVGWGFFSVFC